MSGFKKCIISISSAVFLLFASGCAQSELTAPPVKSSTSPSQVQVKQLYPVYRISLVLKKNPETKTFKMSWVLKIKGEGIVAPFFGSTDILYNRTTKTLKYHYRENNIGLRRSYLFTNVTDEAIHRLSQAAVKTEKVKRIVIQPEGFFRDLTKFGCQKKKI